MVHTAEVIDLLEGELAEARPLALASLQFTPNPCRVHAALVMGVQGLCLRRVGQERKGECRKGNFFPSNWQRVGLWLTFDAGPVPAMLWNIILDIQLAPIRLRLRTKFTILIYVQCAPLLLPQSLARATSGPWKEGAIGEGAGGPWTFRCKALEV